MPDLSKHVGRVRAVGMLEAVSFLFLLGVAMPLKYLAHMPEAVKWTGWVHGGLFILYALVVLQALLSGSLSLGKSAIAFVASLVPFGPFLFDKKLAAEEVKETVEE